MAWPKKHTRTLVVHGETYQWQSDTKNFRQWTVIGKKSGEGQLIFLDPYFLSTTPGQIRKVIIFALSSGWKPDHKHKPLRLGAELIRTDTWDWSFNQLPDDAVPGWLHSLKAGSS